eukprot:gene20956-26877_t
MCLACNIVPYMTKSSMWSYRVTIIGQSRYNNPLIKVIPFASPAPTRRIAIAWRKSFMRLEAMEKIAEAIKAIDSNYMLLI